MPGLKAILPRGRVVERLKRRPQAIVSGAVLAVLVLVAVFAGVLAPDDPNAQAISQRYQGISSEHWLGTDAFGRDILSRLIVGCRVSLFAAVIALAIAIGLGVPLGLLAGFAGKGVDAVLSRIADGLLSMPTLVFAMAIVGILGAGLTNVMVAVGIVLGPRFFRVARAASQQTTSEDHIEAVRADGCSRWRILWRHVMPNTSAPLLVQASLGIGIVINAEASLSFLGLGVAPPGASWGGMIRDGFNGIRFSTWPLIPPCIAVIVTILASFMLGDAIRDALGRGSESSS